MKLEFSEEDMAGGKYLGTGSHLVSICDIEIGQSKAGNDMAVVTFTDSSGRQATDYFPYTPNMRWKVAQLAMACGYSKEHLKKNGVQFPKDFAGKKLTMLIEKAGVEMYNGEEREKYNKNYFPASSSTIVDGDEDIPF